MVWMRTARLPLALAALGAAAAAGWLLLAGGDPAGPGAAAPGGGGAPTAPGEAPAEGAPLPPAAGGGAPADPRAARARERASVPAIPGPPMERPRRDAPPGERLREKDAVPAREPKPLPEGVLPGEVVRADLPEHEARRIEETRELLHGKQVAGGHFHGRPLRKAAEEIAAAAGIPVELEGDDLADEPLEGLFPDTDAFDRLVRIAHERNLRFEVHPDRVVIRR